ncbi:hypothetical protein XPA_009327 [Xanthoria parietina]
MDAEVIAAIAALVVAFVAFLVASAQAIQQYLVSGQLIRLCDSVVYNQMPGQGHRIWQYSQFRFRVVYSIPQIHLLPELWLDISSHVRPLPPDAASLPDLKVKRSKETSAALAGEASWVSFVRAVQHSSGHSMRYVMVDGDADRCPSDLPVVPMQLSMRDVTVMAMSAGMQVTDVSFQSQTISVQGDAGSITCSRHPVLGSLIHFAQKQAFEDHGIQVEGGMIQGDWVARMLDIVTVAGRRFDSVDRKHYEEDEGSWMKASNEGATRIDPEHDTNVVRRRRPKQSFKAGLDHGHVMAGEGDRVPSVTPPQAPEKENPSIFHRPQDGEWSDLPGVTDQFTKATGTILAAGSISMPNSASSIQPSTTSKSLQHRSRWHWRRSGSSHAKPILPISEPAGGEDDNADPNRQDMTAHSSTPVTYDLKSDGMPTQSPVDINGSAGNNRVTDELRTDRITAGMGTPENEALSQKPKENRSMKKPAQPRHPLLLTDRMIYTGQTSALPVDMVSQKWYKEEINDQARQEFIVDKWQQKFQQRRKERSRGRSQSGRTRRPASRRRPAKAFGRVDSADLGPRRNLAIEERRRDPSPRMNDNEQHVVSGDRRIAKSHTNAAHGNRRNRALLKTSTRDYRESRSHRSTSRSSSPSISQSLDSQEHTVTANYAARMSPRNLVHERADFRRNRGSIDRRHPAQHETQRPDTSVERGRKRVRVLEPPEGGGPLVLRKSSPPSLSQEVQPCKSAMRSPTEKFPENLDFIRPGVASSKDSGIPSNAIWTKIRCELVDPEVLDRGRERYEQNEDFVVVLRVLTREEIQDYAIQTQELRVQRQQLSGSHSYVGGQSEDDFNSEISDDSQDSYVREHSWDDEGLTSDLPQDTDEIESPESIARYRMDLDQATTFSAIRRDSMRGVSERTSRTRRTGRRGREFADFSKPAGRTSSSISKTSASQHQPNGTETVMSYAEEIMFLQSDHTLKKLTACTEQCKDVVTTLQFVKSVQPEFESNIMEIRDLIKDILGSVKTLLFHTEPLRGEKKVANIVNTKLGTFLFGLQSSLDIMQAEFDLFDITHLTPSERHEAWERMLHIFGTRHTTSLDEYLAIISKFSAEIASNFQARVFTSPEADLLMKRLAEATSKEEALVKRAPKPANPHRHRTSRSRSRYFLSPSRFTDSPLGSPATHIFHKSSSYNKDDPGPIQPRRNHRRTGSSDEEDNSSSRSDTDKSSGNETDTSSITLASSKNNYTGEMKWFWISQADVLPGYFATPWKGGFSSAECIGSISILLKSLEAFTNYDNSQYVVNQPQNRQWLKQGFRTYPSYAHDAAGGVVVAGTYRATIFDSFKSPIAPLELLLSYEHQVDRIFSSTAQAVVDSAAEVMGLDTWLSIAGRQSEIIDGPGGLLRTLPTLIQQIMTDFHLEFVTLDRTSKDGGSQIIDTISDSLLGYLKEQGLSDAEQLFCLVALLRTAKMALCVARGSNTAKLREVLIHDVEVYLA